MPMTVSVGVRTKRVRSGATVTATMWPPVMMDTTRPKEYGASVAGANSNGRTACVARAIQVGTAITAIRRGTATYAILPSARKPITAVDVINAPEIKVTGSLDTVSPRLADRRVR